MSRLTEWLESRSAWQVVGVYLGGSWVAFEVVATLTESLGLPGWLPRAALVLVAIGLPIVAAASLFGRREGFFTLRNMLILGVAAFALVVALGTAPRLLAPDGATRGPAGPPTRGPVVEDPRPAVAVLPFEDLSPEGDQGYFSEGIAEEIRTALSRIRDIRVAARSSAFAARNRGLEPTRLGEVLGVPFLLDGAVRKDGDLLRITAELVDAGTGLAIWSETYDRRLENVFAIQTEIATSISGALRLPLGLDPEGLVSPTLDLEAYDMYLEARAALRRRGTGVARAISLFESAVARDSAWAPAWAGLAEARAIYPLYPGTEAGESTDSTFWADNLQAGEAAARRALALDERNASALIALGGIQRDRWEWGRAETTLLRAIEIDPDNAEAHIQYAEVLWGVGRLDESLRESARALELDRSPLTLDIHGFVLYMNSRMQEAEATLEEGIALDPAGDMHFLRTVLAQLFLMDGRYREALSRFGSFLPDSAAFRRLGEALETDDPDLILDVPIRGRAQTYARLGRPDDAIAALEDIIRPLPYRVPYEIWDPYLSGIWDMPGFREGVLPHLNLEGARVSTVGPGA